MILFSLTNRFAIAQTNSDIDRLKNELQALSNNNKTSSLVTSYNDFISHTRLHQKRVQKLIKALYNKFPLSAEHSLNSNLVSRFAEEHDSSKFMLYRNGQQISKILYQFYGKKESQLSLENKLDSLKVKHHMTLLDIEIANSFFLRNNITTRMGESNAVTKYLLLIERIADHVDRTEDEVSWEEFARVMIPESKILTNKIDKAMAQFLENNYSQLTRSHAFVSFKKVNRCQYIFQ